MTGKMSIRCQSKIINFCQAKLFLKPCPLFKLSRHLNHNHFSFFYKSCAAARKELSLTFYNWDFLQSFNTTVRLSKSSRIEKTIKLSHGWFISQNWWPRLTQIFSGNFAKLVWLDWILLDCQNVDQDIIIIQPGPIIKTGNCASIIVKRHEITQNYLSLEFGNYLTHL